MQQMDCVYCTLCSNFGVTSDLTPVCAYSEACDLWDPEDSRPIEMRPHYTPSSVHLRSSRAVMTTIPNKDGAVDYYIQQDWLDDILRPFTIDEGNIDQDGSLIYRKHDKD